MTSKTIPRGGSGDLQRTGGGSVVVVVVGFGVVVRMSAKV